MKLIVFFIILILITATFIISNNNLALKEKGNIQKFFVLYFSWAKNFVGNVVKITSEAVKMEWLPNKE